MSIGTAELEILLKARDEASKVLKEASASVEKHGMSLDRLLKPALIGVAVATTAVVAATDLFVRAAMEEEVAHARLQQAVINTGAAFGGEVQDQVDTFVSSLEHMSGFSKVEVEDALAILVEQTDSYAEAMQRETLAADLSRATHVDLYTASRLLGKMTDENVTALNRMGFAIKHGTSESEAFAIISRKVHGEAARYMTTTQGHWDDLGNRITDVKEKLGKAMLPLLSGVARRLTDVFEQLEKRGTIQQFGDFMASLVPTFEQLIDRLGQFFATVQEKGIGQAVIDLVGDLLNKVKEQLPKLGKALDDLGPIGWVIKLALLDVAISKAIGLAEMLFGSAIGLFRGIAGISVLAGTSTVPLMLAIAGGITIGWIVNSLIDNATAAAISKKWGTMEFWLNTIGLADLAMLGVLAVGGSPFLALAITGALVITWLVTQDYGTSPNGMPKEGDTQEIAGETWRFHNGSWSKEWKIGYDPTGDRAPKPKKGPPNPDAGDRWGQPKSNSDRPATLDDIYAAYGASHGGQMIDFAEAQRILATGAQWSDVQGLASGGVVMPQPGGTVVRVAEAGRAEIVAPLDDLRAGGDVHVHFNAPVYGFSDFEDRVQDAIRRAVQGGGFRGVLGARSA